MNVYKSKTVSWPFLGMSLISFFIAAYPTIRAVMKLEKIGNEAIASAGVFGLAGIWALVSSFFSLTIDDKGLRIKQGISTTLLPYSVIAEVMCIPTPKFPRHSNAPARIDIPRDPQPVAILAAYDVSYPWLGSPQALLVLCKGSKNNYVLPHPDAENIVSLIKNKLVPTI